MFGLEDFGAFLGASILIFYYIRKRKAEKLRNELTDPQIQGINRLPSHVVLGGFNNDKEARSHVCQPKCSPFSKSLVGNWKFSLFPNVQSAFSSLGKAELEGLISIAVPGNWQLQTPGDGPIYTNKTYPFPIDPPNVPSSSPCGFYRHVFHLSKSLHNRRVILSFGGVDSAFYVWLNKSFVGFSKDSRLTTEFDVSEICKFGSSVNEIEVIVARYCDGSYLESQDMFKLSGIFRDIFIYSVPKLVHISDFQWNSAIDSTTQIASVDVDVQLRWDDSILNALMDKSCSSRRSEHESTYFSQLQSAWVVTTSLYEEGVLVRSLHSSTSHSFFFDSSSVDALTSDSCFVPLPPVNAKNKFSDFVASKHTMTINCPTLWSAERPHIYTLVVSLRSTFDGTVVQAESCRLGFRTIAVTGGALRINSRAVTIRGVNYHEHDPTGGHCVPSQVVEADIQLMKRHNFNAIRTSHYPQSSWFYELCNLYGLLVVNEANIETHGMKPYAGKLADSPTWKKAFLLRLRRMFERDKVHPCVVAWSLGNESGYGAVHDAMADWVRKRDPSRIVLYEPASYGPRHSDSNAATNGSTGGPAAPTRQSNMATDLLFPMYSRISECITLANMNPDLPLILSEYAHMMGNSGGNLKDYWAAFRQFPRLQGGFIWDWVDQGIIVNDSQLHYRWACGGDTGEAEHDGSFCLNGLNWPDRGLSLQHGLSDSLVRPPASAFPSMSTKTTVCIDGTCLETTTCSPVRSKTQNNAKERSREDYKHLYGLSGCKSGDQCASFSLRGSLPHNPCGGDVRTIFRIDSSIAKPALLEAKQCMKCFDCSVHGLKMLKSSGNRSKRPGVSPEDVGAASGKSPWRNKSSVDTAAGGRQSSSIRIVLPQPRSMNHARDFVEVHESTLLEPFFRMSVVNNFDHVDDIETELHFHAILLCNGIMVASTPMDTISSGYVHKHHHAGRPTTTDYDSSRHSIQELDCEAHFSVELLEIDPSWGAIRSMNESDDVQKVIIGQCWPETAMLDARTLLHSVSTFSSPKCMKLNADGSVTTNCLNADTEERKGLSHLAEVVSDADNISDNVRWTVLPDSTARGCWSLVVVACMSNHTPWASKGYPMGFQQLDVSKHMKVAISSVSIESSKSRFDIADSPTRTSSFLTVPPSPTHSSSVSAFNTPLRSACVNDASPSASEWVVGARCPSLSAAIITATSDDAQETCPLPSSVPVVPDSVLEKNVIVRWISAPEAILATPDVLEPRLELSLHRQLIDMDLQISVVIASATGMIDHIVVNGFNILAERSLTFPDYMPSRLQLHRAPIENDKLGYLSRWRVAGLDRALKSATQQATLSASVLADLVGSDVDSEENVELSRISVRKVSGSEFGLDDGYTGVMCRTALLLENVSRTELSIIEKIQLFQDDPSVHYIFMPAHCHREELFIHEVAESLRICRESLWSDSEVLKGKGPALMGFADGSESDMPRAVLVRLWKPILFMCSTGRKAEQQAVGPMPSWGDDSVADVDSSHIDMRIDVEMVYLLSELGELRIKARIDASEVVVPLPRVGLNFLLSAEAVSHVCWRGAGPHENYSDRKASCVNALHVAPVAGLSVPYIIPGESGARTDVSWLQVMRKCPSQHRLEISPSAGVNKDEVKDEEVKDEVKDEVTGDVGSRTPPGSTSVRITSKGSRLMTFSLLPYTVEDLIVARNYSTLEYFPRPFYSLNLDAYLMGLGGDDSWTASVHDDFTLPADVYSFDFGFEFYF